MQQVREGEIGELGELFERHHSRLYQFLLRLVGRPQVAEDLVQEAFTRMLKYRHTFRNNSRFLPWMYRLAHNVAHDYFRKKPRAERQEDSARETADPTPSAQDELEREESASLLRRALLRLPVDKREVLILSRFETRRYAEIAELLDCSEGAVKVRVHRATAELRQHFTALMAEVTP